MPAAVTGEEFKQRRECMVREITVDQQAIERGILRPSVAQMHERKRAGAATFLKDVKSNQRVCYGLDGDEKWSLPRVADQIDRRNDKIGRAESVAVNRAGFKLAPARLEIRIQRVESDLPDAELICCVR